MRNEYRTIFEAPCCVNERQVEYELVIETPGRVIMVEEILPAVAAAARLEKPYHETMADFLFEKFGGRQTLKAFHHGVEILTERGAL